MTFSNRSCTIAVVDITRNSSDDLSRSHVFPKSQLNKYKLAPILSKPNENLKTVPSPGKKQSNRNNSLPFVQNPQKEILIEDNIQITYDFSTDNAQTTARQNNFNWFKTAKILGILLAFLLIGLQAPYPSATSCYSLKDDDKEKDRNCGVKFIQLLIAGVIVLLQLIMWIPKTFSFVIIFLKLMQVSGLLLIKYQIQRFLKNDNEEYVKVGYIGYVILCACVATTIITEIPGKSTEDYKFYGGHLVCFSAIVVEIFLNKFQNINVDDFVLAFGGAFVLYLLASSLFIFLKAFDAFRGYGSSIFYIYVTGHLWLMYTTIPVFHFSVFATQLGLYLLSLVFYTMMFLIYQYSKFHY